MSNALNFISALYAVDNSVPVSLDINGERVEVDDGTVISENDGKLFAYARTSGGLAFVYRVVEDAKPTDYAGCAVVPTAAIYQPDQHLLILMWALDRLTAPEDAAALAEAFGMPDFEDAIPVPPTKGWQTLRLDPSTFTSIETLVLTYGAEPVADEPADAEPVETYNDAVVINGPYIPAKYDQVITLTTGARRDSKKWKPTAITVEVLVNTFTTHKEDKNKDGKAVVLGDMVPGQRLKNAVKSLYAIGIDIDNGTPGAKIDAALAELGVLAIRSTTHSHNNTRTEIKKDRLVKWSKTLKLTTAIIRQYLAEAENWDQGLIATVEYVGDDQNERGIVAVLEHAPMPKHRIIVPLAAPFVIGKEATTQEEAMKKWGKLPTALAERLGVTLDKACLDPSRLFYLPRHPKGRDFEVKLFVGPLFDWKTLELDSLGDLLDAQLSQGKSKSTTLEGKALGKWWNNRGFSSQIADIIEDHAHDKIRGKASHGWNIECPFDEEHSNAGDPADRACFAVNSGDGSGEFPTVKCQHDSCRERTTLDMIAKMVADGWFEKELLEDESYIAESDHVGVASGCGGNGNTIVPTRAQIDSVIATFTEETNSAQIDGVLRMAIAAGMVDTELEEIFNAIVEKAGRGKRPLTQAYTRLASATDEEDGEDVTSTEALIKRLSQSLGRPFEMPPESMGKCSLAEVEGQIWIGVSNKNRFEPYCSPIMIEGGMNYKDRDHARAMRVQVLHPDGGWFPVDIEMKDLASTTGTPVLEALLKAGCSVPPAGREFILKYFMIARSRGRMVYHRPGFRDGCFICPTGEVLLSKPGSVELAKEMRLSCQARSGSFDEWKSAISDLFAVTAAYRHQAGILIGWVGTLCDLSGDAPCAFTLEGESSSGKSTSQGLAAGHWADPTITKGLFIRAKGTENSQEVPLERGSGTLTALDEIGDLPAKAQQELMFMNQAGAAKRRLQRDTKPQKTRTWGGSVLIVSAEMGFGQRLRSEKVARTGGLGARVVPITYEKKSRLTENHYNFTKRVLANFGWSGPAFVLALADQGYVTSPGKVREEMSALLDRLPETTGTKNVFRRRAARAVAYMWLAGNIAARAGIIPANFDYEELATRIWKGALANDFGPTDPVDQAVTMLLDAIIARRGVDIVEFGSRKESNREAIGYYGAEVNGESVYVLRNDEITKLYNITAPERSVRKQLNEMGFVVRPSTGKSLTWSGFSGLGKGTQYLVLRAALIDSPDPEYEPVRK